MSPYNLLSLLLAVSNAVMGVLLLTPDHFHPVAAALCALGGLANVVVLYRDLNKGAR